MSLPHVAVVALRNFSPFHFSIPCLIFGNILPGQPLFQLTLCAGEQPPLTSAQGFSISTDCGLEVLQQADIIVLPFWRTPAEQPPQALLDALIAAHQRGARLVGLCLGTYLLAHAGLLDGRRAATHWESEQDFKQRFPAVHLDTNALYVEDGQLLTSAGTAAGIDCCLHLVRELHGSQIANRVARRLVVAPHREGGQAQFIEQPIPTSTRDKQMNQLLDYLRLHLCDSHSIDSLADRVLMSRRTFTRRFQQATGMSVGEWLQIERLRRSQALLETSQHSIERIAELTGFGSATSLRQHFRARFNLAPSEWRRAFRGNTKAAQP